MRPNARIAFRSSIAIIAGAAGVAVFAQSTISGNRPETGSYMANQRLSGTLFIHTLDDRGSEPQWASAAGGGASGSGWLRAEGEGMKSINGTGAFNADSNAWLIQGGGELYRNSLAATGGVHLGVLGGFAGGRTDGTVVGSPYTARGDTSGFGTGMYAAWFQNDSSRLGWYTDVWGQFAWFKNKLAATYIQQSDYDSHVFLASVEAGYAMRLSSDWLLAPQGQFLYTHNHTYNFTESDGTDVQGAHRSGWMSRLGFRVQRAAGEEVNGYRVQPYGAVNWWHDRVNDEGVFNGVSTRDMYPSDRFEIKAGVAIDANRRWSGWGDLAYQTGSQSFRAWTMRAGGKYVW